MNANEDILDLVDENDNVIGHISRDDKSYGSYQNFRVVNAFVVNSAGKIWIPRRTETKRIFPGCLDMSVGGHVDSGETYEEAFKRETTEELNLNLDQVPWKEIGYLNPYQVGTSAFMKVYQIDSDEDPNYNKEDFSEAFWLTPNEILARARRAEKVKGDLGQLIRLFFTSKQGPHRPK
ncbi:NUDIX domain-containing protein [Patescibacteria group bacterium]|nr:NUDIX domain-containing protein [Patescibacteria group bacterium]